MDDALRGTLCFKGERGYSAYEVAVQNGFEGSEKDWLDSLNYTRDKKSECPTTGTWDIGDIIWNSIPTIGANIGWVCIKAGSPGTWAKFGTISE